MHRIDVGQHALKFDAFAVDAGLLENFGEGFAGGLGLIIAVAADMGGGLSAGRAAIEGDERNARLLCSLDRGSDRARVERAGDDDVHAAGDEVVDIGRLTRRVRVGDVDRPLDVEAGGLTLLFSLRF